MQLESDRLVLKRLHEDHFEEFRKLDMDPEVMKFIRKASESEEAARANFQKLLDYNNRYARLGAWSIFEKSSGEYLGMGVLINIELKPENEKIEVGYRLAKRAWGKGYATEAAKALIKYGFEELSLEEIYGTTNPDHLVSQKTLMKCGLKDVGTAPYYNGCRFFVIKNHSLG